MNSTRLRCGLGQFWTNLARFWTSLDHLWPFLDQFRSFLEHNPAVLSQFGVISLAVGQVVSSTICPGGIDTPWWSSDRQGAGGEYDGSPSVHQHHYTPLHT